MKDEERRTICFFLEAGTFSLILLIREFGTRGLLPLPDHQEELGGVSISGDTVKAATSLWAANLPSLSICGSRLKKSVRRGLNSRGLSNRKRRILVRQWSAMLRNWRVILLLKPIFLLKHRYFEVTRSSVINDEKLSINFLVPLYHIPHYTYNFRWFQKDSFRIAVQHI